MKNEVEIFKLVNVLKGCHVHRYGYRDNSGVIVDSSVYPNTLGHLIGKEMNSGLITGYSNQSADHRGQLVPGEKFSGINFQLAISRPLTGNELEDFVDGVSDELGLLPSSVKPLAQNNSKR